jgi:hypothetical protein
MERALSTRCSDNSRKDYRTIAELLPEYGLAILSPAKILLEVSPLDRGQAEAELTGLDAWVEEHCGQQGFTWPEYWVYKAALEELAGGHGEHN